MEAAVEQKEAAHAAAIQDAESLHAVMLESCQVKLLMYLVALLLSLRLRLFMGHDSEVVFLGRRPQRTRRTSWRQHTRRSLSRRGRMGWRW
eukprot:COSAG05_NODE_1221_length_5476_cov_72.306305_11_plen_91_part_00